MKTRPDQMWQVQLLQGRGAGEEEEAQWGAKPAQEGLAVQYNLLLLYLYKYNKQELILLTGGL